MTSPEKTVDSSSCVPAIGSPSRSSNGNSMDMSIKNSLSSTITGNNSTSGKLSNDMYSDAKVSDCNKMVEALKSERVESGKSSISRASYSSGVSDSSESICSSFSSAMNKPHKANDARWEAIQVVKGRDAVLGLGHFRLLKRLGCGDIGSVYLAELRGTRCYFAMKVMDKGSLASRKKLLRAQTEREILASLDHPFLPTLYTHFETDKFSCLVMEFCSGGDLHTLRQRQPNKHFSESAARCQKKATEDVCKSADGGSTQVIFSYTRGKMKKTTIIQHTNYVVIFVCKRFYASEVLLALEYLHMLGVVYRDLKPENVLVREEGHIMLSDFDLSLRCVVSPTLVKSTSYDLDPSRRIPAYCIQPSCIEPACVTPACIQPSCFVPRFLPQWSKKNRKPKNEIGNSAVPLPELMAEPTSARSMSFVGTHEYLAPEIIKGEGHGSAVDWWTFGIFLYELLHGKTPFKGAGNRATLFNVIGQPLKFPEMPTVSFAAKDLIKGLLVKDPQHRLAYKRGATEIKQHPFFEGVNWALIRSTIPPEIPKPIDFEFTTNRTVPVAEKKTVHSDPNSSGSYLDFDFF